MPLFYNTFTRFYTPTGSVLYYQFARQSAVNALPSNFLLFSHLTQVSASLSNTRLNRPWAQDNNSASEAKYYIPTSYISTFCSFFPVAFSAIDVISVTFFYSGLASKSYRIQSNKLKNVVYILVAKTYLVTSSLGWQKKQLLQ